MLTPERSIQIQKSIGADIMMQVSRPLGLFLKPCGNWLSDSCFWDLTKIWNITKIVVKVGHQGWSSWLVIIIGCQGWSSRLVVEVGRQGWSSRLVVKIVVTASSSASRVSFFLQFLVTHSNNILLFSWMTWWTPNTKTWTGLKRQGTELSGGWTGEPERSVRFAMLEF